MKQKFVIAAACAAIALSPLATSAVSAKSFKGKYYKECYAGMKEAAKLVKPKKAKKKGGGLFGSLASVASVANIAGVGGGAGNAFKVANTVNKIQKYQGIIENVSAFSSQMTTDYPDPNDRFAAYGNHMSTDAANLLTVQTAITNSQSCYNEAYDTLMAEQEAGTIKKKKAKKRMKEIRKGTVATGDVLIDAMNHINKNLNSYDQVIGGEQTALSTGMGGLAGQFLGGRAGALMTAAQPVDTRSADSYRYMHVKGMQAGTKASLISGLAGLASYNSQDQGADIQPGVQAIAKSSEEYLTLHNQYMDTVEAQRQLETKVQKK